jgi:hypothetical protein
MAYDRTTHDVNVAYDAAGSAESQTITLAFPLELLDRRLTDLA